MTVAYGSLPFEEQIAFWKGKKLVPTLRWNDLIRAQHDVGFMVAGAMKADLLTDLHAAVDKAITKGTTLAEFRKDFNKLVAKNGWTGWTGEGSEAGRAWRTRIIYETNLQTSYQAGRWAQIQEVKQDRPYLLYKHSRYVAHPREEHLAWDGLIVSVDDPWVKTHFPPNGWSCKCRMFSIAQHDLKKYGKTGPDTPPDNGNYEWTDKKTGKVHTFPKGIDPFFDYTPGASRVDYIRQQMLRKAEAMPPAIGSQLKDFINQPALIKSPQTVANAEKLAESMGVKAVDFKGNRIIANDVMPALQIMNDKNLPIPAKLEVNQAFFAAWAKKQATDIKNDAAVFLPPKEIGTNGLIFLNPAYSQWGQLEQDVKLQFSKNYWSTDNKHHVIFHESGHLAHYANNPLVYLQLYGKELSPKDVLIAKKVSLYAVKSKLEFVAEVFAGLVAGKKFDDDIMKLYISLGGLKL